MCLPVLLALFVPRVTLAILWFFGYTQGRFHPWWLGVLGFLFLPYLTCAYLFVHWYSGGNVDGPVHLVILAVGLLLDLGSMGWGRSHRARRVRAA
jgi:hypothetical protein